jgi:cytochrome c heme-lyase
MGGSQSRASASPAGAPSGGVAAGPPGSAPAPCAGMREQAEPGSDCPVPEEYRGKHGIFNVYNQPIDPRNNMPATASQAMAPGQRTPISTARQPSTIPKSGASGTWTYPSPQMFYNSLVRKGKAEDCSPEDMHTVVSVHNSMNEDTWRRVVTWEKLHANECRNPMLLRFLGRPDDLSPLAFVRKCVTGETPFDRHDWYVDRNGKQVRYVIDYYFHEDKAGTPGQFDLVVRPAADDLESVMDRVKMSVYVACASVGIPCPITGNNGAIGAEAAAPNTTAPEA